MKSKKRLLLKEFATDSRVLFISFMLVVYTAVTVITPYSPLMWIAMLGGLLVFFITEYVSHRYILHGWLSRMMPKAHEGHDKHHENPQDFENMLTPNTYNVPVHLLFWVIFCLALQSIHLGSALMIGVALYHLLYEWVHYVSHRPITPRTRWGKWMKKYHLLHHFKDEKYYFGVTNPALDMMLGTDQSPAGPSEKTIAAKD
ncbi:sterol desaturase family protein [Paenibacillus sp. J22TS3]|uniref:sterol desaturase family protein n=1 Tax=Paenibacillus sp. J22TS3 TaxID=2807192 RepID=UPI001B189089|nr:sterol desaturase family protein [Paenibacillus sp. J22TS3]GIP22612.1 fatty acid hydroxylase [Paenibacillus sp. J22TS3]